MARARVRLMALDIDGTLLRSDKTISERTRRAIERAREDGVRLALVTGRRQPSARRVSDDLGEMEALLPVFAADLGGAARIERTVYPSTGVVLLDVIHPSVGKAEALSFLQERWGIASSETLAIGDNWNDLEMIEGAGLGFVMGNADPALLARGLAALPTNDEDGVAYAIEQHVLRT